ncbi:spike base protein, RCAP_Rcc01079 family [Pseudogemmobacter bohemicus]|uniref:spike base protein, RCAP_Rcc01079 family n=1 Tax=Pseudogemmobacter bohemicus TaxID=2250708 RepID=UPI0013007AD1|nr:hypothetical protein [Pseudogemmobacter bohemicus]
MADQFKDFSKNVLAGAIGSFPVTPSDTVDLTEVVRQITISGAGTISWLDREGNVHTTASLPVGTYPIIAKRIRATGTTATGITGWI